VTFSLNGVTSPVSNEYTVCLPVWNRDRSLTCQAWLNHRIPYVIKEKEHHVNAATKCRSKRMNWEWYKLSWHLLNLVVGGLLDDLAVDLISQELLLLPQLSRRDRLFFKSHRSLFEVHQPHAERLKRCFKEHWPEECGSSSLSGCSSSSSACPPWTASGLEGWMKERRRW